MADCVFLSSNSLDGGRKFELLESGLYFDINFCSLDDCIDFDYSNSSNNLRPHYEQIKENCLARYGVGNLPYFVESVVNPCYGFQQFRNYFTDYFGWSYYDYLLFNNPFYGGNFERKILPLILDNYQSLYCFANFKRIIPICNFYILSILNVYFNDRFYHRALMEKDGRYYPYSHRFHFADGRGNRFYIDEDNVLDFLQSNDLVLIYEVVYDCESNSLNLPLDPVGEPCCRFVWFGEANYKDCVCDKLSSLNDILGVI